MLTGGSGEGPFGLLGEPGSVRQRRPFVAAGLAALWALLVGLSLITCVVMLLWVASPNSSGDSASAWRASGLVWLSLHGVPVSISGESISLFPLGGLLLGLLLNRRGGRWTAQLLPGPAPTELAAVVLGTALLYGAGGAVVAWLSAGAESGAEPGRAALWAAAVAVVGVLWGFVGEARLLRDVRGRMTDATWRTLSGGLAVVLGIFGAGAVLLAGSLANSAAEVGAALAGLRAGSVGGAGLTVLQILLLPTLAVWAGAITVGPGFALGSAGHLSAFGGASGVLPAVPVLAAVPATAPAWAPALLLLPVLLGGLAGRIRWSRDLPTTTGALTSAAGLAVTVGVLSAGMFALASGSLGSADLRHIGPNPLVAAAAAAGLAAVGFLGEAGLQALRLVWYLQRAQGRAPQAQPEPSRQAG